MTQIDNFSGVFMIITLAYLKNQNQVILRQIDSGSEKVTNKVVNFDALEKESLHALFIDQTQAEEEISNDILNFSKFFPIRDVKEFQLNEDSFSKSTNSELLNLYSKVNSTWTLQNNISLLENMSSIKAHLLKLWPNDRTSFFEEFWFLVKKNLGALDLNIVYNDLKATGKNDDKNTLIQVSIKGNRLPNPVEGGEFEKSLMDNYSDEFVSHFNLVEFNQDKGQMVIAGNIKKSPYLMMITLKETSKLQQAVVKNFIEALN